jgi:Ca-activated chloride channel homolog
MSKTYPFDPYTILGVARHVNDDDLKKTYRKLVQRLKPDKIAINPGAQEQYEDVTAAYELLSDSIARRDFDQYIAKQSTEDDTYFTLRVTPSKRALMVLPEEQVMYLLAEIFPAPQFADTPKKETTMNITLVLDVSNSMKGSRIERVKVAAQKIIEDLSSNDKISVVVFNDRAETIIPATAVKDKKSLRARISVITPSGGTEIFQGLNVGVQQNRMYFDSRSVNTVILLTDGHTYGDQDACFELAKQAVDEGIVISAMGLGSDWNDEFLDKLAAITGGSSSFINSADMVSKFLNDHVRNLSNAFAERLQISIAPDPDIHLEMAFRLAPNPQPLISDDYVLPLSSLQQNRPVSLLLQFLLPANMPASFRTLGRLVVSGDILQNKRPAFKAISDVSIEVTDRQINDEPPGAIMDALSKLTLYRLQEKARDAVEKGNVVEATRRLQNLATRLLEMGHNDLARETLSEAQRVAQTKALSAQGRMTIKYQTRALLGPGGLEAALTNIISSDKV